MENTNQPIVIDNGSGVIKAGFAGQDYPSGITRLTPAYFPSIVGRPKVHRKPTQHTKIMAGAVEGEHFIGKRAQELRGLLSINHPMNHGKYLSFRLECWHFVKPFMKQSFALMVVVE
jgi:centractin